ncbi:putative membrane protein [Georgenia satyanarayanai]|uniref:Putative membrane protein n=1 Tax=Georgenia satyanarayanai TaxID=860221 RepID=A0A2Y8ZXL9_9MICO|nr:cytochrome c oxidase assembly protein [Georgenia satyanarayanai]PYG02223.1 putative membrane protein [Georgenia satyanarayanai]SSA37061.1 putative membrane protein [Georgenia satyanarayanai]
MSPWLPGALAAVVLVGGYLTLLARRPAGLPPWPAWRTAAWVAGALTAAAALAPPLTEAAGGDHRAHMAQHLLLGMYAPLGLVAAAPVRLALGSLPTRGARRLSGLLRSRLLQVLSHPVVAAVLNVGGMVLLYLTPLHERAAASPALTAVVLAHFLLAGWLYTWSVAGPDPAPHRPGLPVRLGVLVVAAGAHAYLAKTLYARAVEGHHGTAHAEAGAQLMYYGGDGAELLLAVMLLAGWYRRARPRASSPGTRVAEA